MKVRFLVALLLALNVTGLIRAADFERSAAEFVAELGPGVVLANALEIPSGDETAWGNPELTRTQIAGYRQLENKTHGFRAIRLPITWSAHFDHGDPGHRVDPGFLARVKEVSDWCLAEGFVVIIDVHHDGGIGAWPQVWLNDEGHQDEGREIFADLWRQIAEAFRDYDERLVFEAFNELKDHGDGAVSGYAEIFYRTVRASGGNNSRRYLMIPTPSAAVTEAACAAWRNPDPTDNRIIASVHSYCPEGFTYLHETPVFDSVSFAEAFGAELARLKRHFIDKGIPVVITETAAELQYDGKTNLPNDDQRVRWIRAFAAAVRKAGIRAFLVDTGNDFKTGFVNRKRSYATHREIPMMFVGTLEGVIAEKEAEEIIASVRIEPRKYVKSDCVLLWKLDGQSYRECWGQMMGREKVSGNGVVLSCFSTDSKGNLRAKTEEKTVNMLHQQFWADQCEAAVETMRAYMQTHGETRLAGRKLVFTLTALNGTTAVVSGAVRFSGLHDTISFGVGPDEAGALKATPGNPKRVVEIPLPEDSLTFGRNQGLNVELKLFPGRWGSHGKLDCMISPIELK